MLNVKWALRSAWFLNTNLTNRTNLWLLTEVLFSHTDLTDLTDFDSSGVFACESWWVPLLAMKKIRGIREIRVGLVFHFDSSRSFYLWIIVSTIACNEEDPWDLWDPCETSLSESHCKDTTFHFPNSPMLIVAHRYSPIITDKYQGSPKWKKI